MKKLLLLLFIHFALIFSTSAQIEKKRVLESAGKIVVALKDRDFKKISEFVNPVKGLWFAPFALDMSLKKNVSKSRLAKMIADKRKYYWAKPPTKEQEYTVKMSFAEYYEKFLFNFDYQKSDSITFNDSRIVLNSRISPNKEIRKAFPKGVFVEYLIDAEESNGTSFFLVFQNYRSKSYLVCLTQIDKSSAHYIF